MRCGSQPSFRRPNTGGDNHVRSDVQRKHLPSPEVSRLLISDVEMSGREDDLDAPSGADFDIAAVYSKHRDAMYRIAYARLRESGRAAESADVVHDVIVRLLQSPPRGVQNWEAFLVTAVINAVADRLKSATSRRDGGRLDESSAHNVPSDLDLDNEVVEALDLEHRAGIVWDSLSVLSERERKVVWEHVACERPRKDVAAEVGVTVQRITQIKTQALRKLREAMDVKGGRE